jgi:hypothetical protein
MRARAQAVRERQATGNFTKSWPLSGKKAIVDPGKSVLVRLAPRWDISDSMMTVDGARVPNPDYKKRVAFVVAYEHWWDSEGKTSREYCPKTLDPQATCPICVSSAVLLQSASKEDREYGKRISAKEVFIFNAVVGNPRKLGDDKLADIRIIACSGTQYNKISDIMNGGQTIEQQQFARGDITHPSLGYDLLFNRPMGGGGERWDVTVAPDPSPLYSAAERAAFTGGGGWATRLLNLEKMLQDETKDAAGIFKAYYGRDPELNDPGMGGPRTTPPQAPQAPPQIPAVQEPASTESSPEPEGPDDEFMPRASGPSQPRTSPPAPPKAAPRPRR